MSHGDAPIKRCSPECVNHVGRTQRKEDSGWSRQTTQREDSRSVFTFSRLPICYHISHSFWFILINNLKCNRYISDQRIVDRELGHYFRELVISPWCPICHLPHIWAYWHAYLLWCLFNSTWNITVWSRIPFNGYSLFELKTGDQRRHLFRSAEEWWKTHLITALPTVRQTEIIVWCTISFDGTTLLSSVDALETWQYINDILCINDCNSLLFPAHRAYISTGFQAYFPQPDPEMISSDCFRACRTFLLRTR